MRGTSLSRTVKWTLHYAVLLIYVAVALFPLYWLVKVSITPNDILYKQGTDLLPSRFSLEHYATVVGKSDFLLFFRNSIIVSGVTSIASTLLATASGYAFSRFLQINFCHSQGIDGNGRPIENFLFIEQNGSHYYGSLDRLPRTPLRREQNQKTQKCHAHE